MFRGLGGSTFEQGADTIRPLVMERARLTKDTAASATSIAINMLPRGVEAYSGWVLIDSFTPECELRQITGRSGKSITVEALTYAHSKYDEIIFLEFPVTNVAWWGGKGDNSTNNDIPFARTATAAIANDCEMHIPPGIYVMTTTLDIDPTTLTNKSGLTIRGPGSYRGCQIKYSGSGYCIDVSGSGGVADSPQTRFTICNISISGGGSSTPTGGINLNRTFLSKLVNIEIVQFNNANAIYVNATNVFNLVVDRCHIAGGTSSTPYGLAGIRIGSVDEGVGQAAWSCSAIHITDSIIQKLDGYGVWLHPDHSESIDSVVIDGCLFTENSGGHVRFANGGQTGWRFTTVEIRNCHGELAGRTGASTIDFVDAIYVQDVDAVIINNYYNNVAHVGVHLQDCGHILVTPGTYVTATAWQGILGDQAVTSITRSGSTATVTISGGHNYATGIRVRISGATQSEYNGVHTITVTSSTQFAYTVSGTPATPATGTIKANASIAIRLQAPDTHMRGMIMSQSIYANQVGTLVHSDESPMDISWGGVKSVITNTEYNQQVLEYPVTHQGTIVHRGDTSVTGRDFDEYIRFVGIPDGVSVLNFVMSSKRVMWGSTDPATAGSTSTFSRGDIMFNDTPSAGGTAGWVCTTAGTPGTWKTFGAIAA